MTFVLLLITFAAFWYFGGNLDAGGVGKSYPDKGGRTHG